MTRVSSGLIETWRTEPNRLDFGTHCSGRCHASQSGSPVLPPRGPIGRREGVAKRYISRRCPGSATTTGRRSRARDHNLCHKRSHKGLSREHICAILWVRSTVIVDRDVSSSEAGSVARGRFAFWGDHHSVPHDPMAALHVPWRRPTRPEGARCQRQSSSAPNGVTRARAR